MCRCKYLSLVWRRNIDENRAMVSMPFHQIMRSTTPIFTILIYRFRFNRSYSTKVYLSLIPIVLGVGLATYGDYYFTMTGFILTLLGVILAAVKVSFPLLPPVRKKVNIIQ